jgi:hypothetical protein
VAITQSERASVAALREFAAERRIGSAVGCIGRTCLWMQISPFWTLAKDR